MVQTLARAFPTDGDISSGMTEHVPQKIVNAPKTAEAPIKYKQEKLATKGVAFFASHLIGSADRAFTQAVCFKADISHKGHSDITMTGKTVSVHGHSKFEIEKHVGKTTGRTIGYLVRAIG